MLKIFILTGKKYSEDPYFPIFFFVEEKEAQRVYDILSPFIPYLYINEVSSFSKVDASATRDSIASN